MIGYVKGKLLSYSGETVLLENNGVGYEISCSAEALRRILENGEGAVYTYLAVREDGLSLYGFIDAEEKEMFLKLISVSGVGPKMGIGVLSCMSVKDLCFKIATEDIKGLSAVKGLGKKTAERIILELKDKVDAYGAQPAETNTVAEEPDEDAVAALLSLGFTKSEITKALAGAKESGATTLEQQIAYAMRRIK